jgi:hypothetical protein
MKELRNTLLFLIYLLIFFGIVKAKNFMQYNDIIPRIDIINIIFGSSDSLIECLSVLGIILITAIFICIILGNNSIKE